MNRRHTFSAFNSSDHAEFSGRIGPEKAGRGLGIHGEARTEQVEYADANGAMGMVIDRLETGGRCNRVGPDP